MTEPTITFFDIDSIFEGQCMSPNTWRTRFSLNYKGIPYKTVWVEFVEIEALCKKLGAPPTINLDGSPHYTLPVIQDHKTGAVVSDSPLIAEYLDKTYPSTPPLYPAKSLALQHAFTAAFFSAIMPILEFVILKVYTVLKPASQERFRSTREAMFGKRLEDIVPQGDDRVVKWANVKAGFGSMDGWLKKSGGPFIMGDVISFADITIVSYVLWLKTLFGEDSELWQDIKAWHDGRWDGLLGLFEKFQGDAF